jgi:hypothetical protein
MFFSLVCPHKQPSSQLVQVGPLDPHYCDKETVKPNLLVADNHTSIHLVFKDASGAPFSSTPLLLAPYANGHVGTFREIAKTDINGSKYQ